MTKREYVVAEGRKNGERGDWDKIAGERGTLYNGLESQEVFERPFFLHIERTHCTGNI